MARIIQYNAPTETLTESTRGAAAFEQAGRRLGPLYNETAIFQRDQGKITAQGYKELTWPFDIAKLQEAQTATTSRGGRAGNISGLANRGTSTGRIGLPDNGSAVTQVSRGAAALGNALSDGGYQLAGTTLTEEGGELITSAASQKLFRDYNKDLDTRSSQYVKDLTEAGLSASTQVDFGGRDSSEGIYGSLPNDAGPRAQGATTSAWSGLVNALSNPSTSSDSSTGGTEF